MPVEWNNCFLCLKDLGKNGGKRGRRVEGVDENSRIILVLNYLLGTKLSRKEHSNGTLDSLIRLLSDAAPPTSPERKRKGGSSNPGISICESCEVDVVLVAELHQQLEVIQMRLVEVLKGLRRKVVECSGVNKGEAGTCNFMKEFEDWLGTKNEEDVREHKMILEGVKGFQNLIVSNDKNFVDIPRVFLGNLSNYRAQTAVEFPVLPAEPLQIATDHVIKTEALELEDDVMMDFEGPPSPFSDHSSEMPTCSNIESRQKKTKANKPLVSCKTVLKSQRKKKKKDVLDIKPELKDESIATNKKFRSSSFVASARISSMILKPKKCRATSREKKYRKMKRVPAEFQLKSHIVREGPTIRTRYVCRTCSYYTSIIYVFENHLKIHDEELQHNTNEDKQLSASDNPEAATTVINCQECERTFRSQQYYQFHMAGHTGSHEILCDVCQKKYSPFEIQEHMKSHSEKVFPCPNCSVCCSSREKYIDHLKNHTNSPCQHICDLCQETFNTRPKLLGHYDEVHPGVIPKLICGFNGCQKGFLSAELLQTHRKGHENKKEYLCTHCGKVLTNSETLKIHWRLHENINPFTCPHCPDAFPIKANLNRHLIANHGAPKYKCQYCDKEYVEQNSLKIHLRLHTGTGVQCKECGKVFMTEKLLKRHMVVHSDDRPVVCKICGARFKDQGWMKNHMRIHEGDKRWKCQYCDKAFVFEDYLIQHVRTHTGEKPYCCETCGKTFNQYGALYTHKRKCGAGQFPLSRKQHLEQAESKQDVV